VAATIVALVWSRTALGAVRLTDPATGKSLGMAAALQLAGRWPDVLRTEARRQLGLGAEISSEDLSPDCPDCEAAQ